MGYKCLTAYNEYKCNNCLYLNIEVCGLTVSYLLSYKYSREMVMSTNLFFDLHLFKERSSKQTNNDHFYFPLKNPK
jgi:hypothetical protein